MSSTPEQRWDRVLIGTGRPLSTRNKLVANRDRNWLVALTALACSKFKAGNTLSDFEQHMIRSLQSTNIGTKLIAAMEHVHTATPPALKRSIFPTGFADLNTTDSFSFSDLAKAAPDLVKSTFGGRNVRIVDIESIHAGRARLRDQMAVSQSALSTHASSILRAVMPQTAEPSLSPAQAKSANRYVIKANSFRCLEESSEWSASDEVYWLFGSVAKDFHMSMATHIFNGVDKNEFFNFGNQEGCFWGMDCQPHTFPEGDIGAVATLVEHDEGDPSDILKAWTTGFIAAGAILTAAGVTAWVGAVVAAIGAIGGVFIELMADDHIADASWSFNQASIGEVVGKHGGSYDVTQIFTDGDASYRLRIRLSRVV